MSKKVTKNQQSHNPLDPMFVFCIDPWARRCQWYQYRGHHSCACSCCTDNHLFYLVFDWIIPTYPLRGSADLQEQIYSKSWPWILSEVACSNWLSRLLGRPTNNHDNIKKLSFPHIDYIYESMSYWLYAIDLYCERKPGLIQEFVYHSQQWYAQHNDLKIKALFIMRLGWCSSCLCW